WTILLGIAYATVILAGAPEAMLDEALLVVAFAAMSAGFNRERWWRVLSRCAAGVALALSLAAIQWLPGLEAIRNSQRGTGVFAAAGSFPTPFSIFALVPYIDGGYGHLGETSFFGQYNLPEVGIYLGVLPLIALVTMLHPRWPSRIPPRDRLTWYVVGVFGYLLALGSNTPLEHLFNSLPLYGHQRLQSRNMITVATAVCVLFAGWIDRTEAPRRRDPLLRYDRIMALVPFALVAALCIWALAAPGSLVHVFAGVAAGPGVTHTVRLATVIAVALCAGAAAVVWVRPLIGTVSWARLAAVFVAIDLGLMAFTSQLIQFPPNELVSGTTPVQQLTAAHLVPSGRMVNYDPQAYASYPWSPQGVPDLNIIPRLPSVSGYASIVNGNYESATHTHEQYDLDIGQLASGTLDRLDLREVVTVPEYFLVPLESMPRTIGDIRQKPENITSDPVLPRGYGAVYNATAYPFYPGPRPALRPGQTASWFFGESLEPDSATLILSHAASPGTIVRFGALTADGSTRWGTNVVVAVGSDRVTGPLPRVGAVGLSVQAVGSLPSQRVVVNVGGHPYALGGSLSSAIVPGPWHVAGFSQGYAVFTLQAAPVPIAAVTAAGRHLPVQVVSSSTKSEQIRVIAPTRARVIRSVAWDPGWTGTVSVNGGPSRSVAVTSVDLVQQIRVPAGNDLVTFHYRPRHLLLASILSLGACGFLVVLLVGWLVIVLRRRRSRADPEAGDAAEQIAEDVPERVG
ncbi:MAG TPA: hypothetical protein VK283_00790, partial [Acidimicrobiales bacterium]|nr:hypothetical protein [Acidimicrobiales bacterium]